VFFILKNTLNDLAIQGEDSANRMYDDIALELDRNLELFFIFTSGLILMVFTILGGSISLERGKKKSQ
jgi:hypothetical protein